MRSTLQELRPLSKKGWGVVLAAVGVVNLLKVTEKKQAGSGGDGGTSCGGVEGEAARGLRGGC